MITGRAFDTSPLILSPLSGGTSSGFATLTRSRPFARPAWAFAVAKFLSPLPQWLKSPPSNAEKGIETERGAVFVLLRRDKGEL
jgi:hypothetical protein